jgi:hypothetical protein
MNEFSRLDLSDYEVKQLHQVTLEVKKHSLAVGHWVLRYGHAELLGQAVALFDELKDKLVQDKELRVEAFGYAEAMANYRGNDYHASQAYLLCCRFEYQLYQAVIAERKDEK